MDADFHMIIKPSHSSDSEAFMRGFDPYGMDPEDLKPEPAEAPDILAIAQKEHISKAPRVAIDPAFLNAPDMDSDVDDDSLELDPMMKIVAITPEPLSDFTAEYFKRAGEQFSNTLKKRLGIVTTTIRRDENGTRWLRGFDAAGKMVDCRALLGSGEDE